VVCCSLVVLCVLCGELLRRTGSLLLFVRFVLFVACSSSCS